MFKSGLNLKNRCKSALNFLLRLNWLSWAGLKKTQDIQNVVRFLDWDVFEQFERIVLYRLCLLSSPENDTVEYNDKLSIAEMRQNKARLMPGPAVHMGTVGVCPNHFLKKSV